jgi:hypothetical protein
MEISQLVVVKVHLTLARHAKRGLIAARFKELGLTAYGSTEAQAILSVKRLFNKFVHAYKEAQQLGLRLDQAGVEWYWADDNPASTYEDTNELFDDAWVPLQRAVRAPEPELCPMAA